VQGIETQKSGTGNLCNPRYTRVVTRNVAQFPLLRSFSGSSPRFCLNSLFTGSIHEIDSSITQLQHDLSIFPRSNPRRPLAIYRIAIDQVLRYDLSNQREDLDKAIVRFTESILLSPHSWLQYNCAEVIARLGSCIASPLRPLT
jgi:hypothetical protein